MGLPEPSFIMRDPVQITNELVSMYESMTGKTLQPAQVERIIIDLIAYRETLIRIAIQEAAKQNLVDFATFPMLDHLGAFYGAARLEPQPARCPMRAVLTTPQAFDVIIPAGTRVETKDGKVVFHTEAAATVPAGQGYIDVWGVAETAGTIGNDYVVGDVCNILEPIPYVASITNTEITSGGADWEDDDHYRDRIKLAPERFSNAGSKEAYIYWAKATHQDIIDVAVMSPSDGVVNVYPLMKNGNPDANILDLVLTTLNNEKIRPMTDRVSALSPTNFDFSIELSATLYKSAIPEVITPALESSLDSYTSGLRTKLSLDIVDSQIIGVTNSIQGVYEIAVTLKDAAGVPFTKKVLAENEWANCTSYTVTIAGYVDG